MVGDDYRVVVGGDGNVHLGELNTQVERHRADDLVQRHQDAHFARRDNVVNRTSDARARALHVICVDVSVAVFVEAFGEGALAELGESEETEQYPQQDEGR